MNPLKCTKTGGSHLFDCTEEKVEEIRCQKCGASYLSFRQYEDAYNEIKNATTKVIDSTNVFSADFVAAAVYDAFRHNHNTLRQKFINSIQQFISIASNDCTDERDEASIEWCQKVAKIPAQFPFI